MDATGYVGLARQTGLMQEMQVIANNMANAGTTGFRREGVIFAEYVQGQAGGPSLSMAHATGRAVDLAQAGLTQTGGTYDLAIRGAGFFQIATPNGPRLTRAGAFTPDAAGNLVTPQGDALLDDGGSPMAVPPGARRVQIAADGTLSADGAPLGRVGLWLPDDPNSLRHVAGTQFSAGSLQPATATLQQGALEDSNVEPVAEVARMIEVQRAYELGQGFLDHEDERLRGVIQTLGR